MNSVKIILRVSALKRLCKRKKYGIVHSVYKNVVNLMVENEIFTLHTAEIPMTPISIIIEKNVDLQANKPVVFEEKGIRIGEVFLQYVTNDFWDPKITQRISSQERGQLLTALGRCIGEQQGRKGCADAVLSRENATDDFVTQALRGYIWELKAGLEQFGLVKPDIWEVFVKRMLGAGIGLTPSGDDFLVGLLLACTICAGEEGTALREILVPLVETHQERTNTISRAFLLAACKQEFGFLLHQLLEQEQNQQSTYQARVSAVVETGHSSGLDTLNGLYLGLQLLPF